MGRDRRRLKKFEWEHQLKALVIGGTGPTGPYLVNGLIEQKWTWLPSRRYLAASYGLLGKTEEAQTALDSLLKLDPRFTISKAKKAHPFKNAADFDRLAEGLRAAGLQA